VSENSNRGAIAVKLSRIFNRSLLQQPALQLIYDTAPIGLAVLSLDCRYLQLNQRLTEICGLSVEDHLGRSVRDCVPALADAVEGIVRSIMSTGERWLALKLLVSERTKRKIAGGLLIGTRCAIQRAKSSGVNVAAEEITERKRAEAVLAANDKALRESELRFRELADNISQFAWTADASGWIYWYNKRWHDYTGTTLEDMEGWDWQKVHHPEHVDRVVERIRRCFETGNPWEDTFPLRGKDGTYRWFLSRALPIRNEAGDVVRWFGTNTDVTEQIEAEDALRISVERQTATADILKVIASSPSHVRPVFEAIAERFESINWWPLNRRRSYHRRYSRTGRVHIGQSRGGCGAASLVPAASHRLSAVRTGSRRSGCGKSPIASPSWGFGRGREISAALGVFGACCLHR